MAASSFLAFSTCAGLLATGMPAVDLAARGSRVEWPKVAIDDAAIGRMAARHLIERGYRRFAALNVSKSGLAWLRVAGFVEC